MMWQMLGSTGERRRFCEENFLSHFAMTTIQDLRSQYVQTLRGLGFVDESYVYRCCCFFRRNLLNK